MSARSEWRSRGLAVAERAAAHDAEGIDRAASMLRVFYADGIRAEQYEDVLLVAQVLDKLSRIATRRDSDRSASSWGDIASCALIGMARDEASAPPDPGTPADGDEPREAQDGDACEDAPPDEGAPEPATINEKSRAAPPPAPVAASDLARFAAAFERLYDPEKKHKPLWTSGRTDKVKRLLRKHGAAECIRRAEQLFARPPPFLAGTRPDLGTFVEHFDQLGKEEG